ncbi:MAG: hypothetical protein CVT47_00235 [Thermoplasmata archaeon HGW-Thermoplasmata-2]|nr:MAG: hypothetical protein CVT47_00235 [Thermoplasmata archaeon HGW-Thermoplasmata-2]
MGEETVSQDKLRMVLDYLPCTPCLKMPSEEQRYLCTVCNRLNRTVARKCLFAKERIESAVASAVIVGDKVYLTNNEWEKIQSYLAHPPAVEADKEGKVCLTIKQWDDIVDEIEYGLMEAPAGPEALGTFESVPEMPELFDIVPEISSESGAVKIDDDIEVVYGEPKVSGPFELIEGEEQFEEVKEEPEMGEKAVAEEPGPRYVTSVKVFPATANVDEEIARWAEERGAVVKSKIPIRVKQR